MTREQYLALCVIGGIAVVALLEAIRANGVISKLSAGNYKPPATLSA